MTRPRTAGLAGTLLAATLTLHGGPASRPGAAAPVSAARGCEAFGPGFVRVDGSDTCVRINGSVRVEGSYVTGGSTGRR